MLKCEHVIGNSHDTYIALKRLINGNNVVVEQVPRKVSPICSIFVRRGGTIQGTVNGSRQNSAELPQGGMVILRILTFSILCSSEVEKAKLNTAIVLPTD